MTTKRKLDKLAVSFIRDVVGIGICYKIFTLVPNSGETWDEIFLVALGGTVATYLIKGIVKLVKKYNINKSICTIETLNKFHRKNDIVEYANSLNVIYNDAQISAELKSSLKIATNIAVNSKLYWENINP